MSGHHEDRLDGWKAIADFLTRDERTVQRWAKERGLPVHRVPGGKGASVFAYRDELEIWLSGGPHTLDPAATIPVSPSHSQPQTVVVAPPPTVRSRRMIAAGVAVVTVAIAALAFALLPSPATPESAEFVNNTVVAYAHGRVLWRAPIPRPDDTPRDAFWRLPTTSDLQVVDLNGDGAPEVLASLALVRPVDQWVRDQLFCFSSTGTLRWNYTPEATLKFGDRVYEGPWRIGRWLVAADSSVWFAVRHEPWWPAFFASVDSAGQALVRFVHPGHTYWLTELPGQAHSYILAAGINNEYASAMLAVLDLKGLPATAPSTAASTAARFLCRDCPEGRPARYLLLPRSELNLLSGMAYNRAYDIDVGKSGIEISVQEVAVSGLRAIYRLSSSFVPESVGFSDAYWETHRRWEREGRLKHSAEDCPVRREGMKVRMWDPQQGWTDHVVPHGGV